MRTMTYVGPLDTLEVYDPKDPEKVIFSEHLHPGKSYKVPDGVPVIDNMIGRKLFVDPKAETAASPVNDTSPAAGAGATVPATPAEAGGKTKRS